MVFLPVSSAAHSCHVSGLLHRSTQCLTVRCKKKKEKITSPRSRYSSISRFPTPSFLCARRLRKTNFRSTGASQRPWAEVEFVRAARLCVFICIFCCIFPHLMRFCAPSQRNCQTSRILQCSRIRLGETTVSRSYVSKNS